MGDLQRVIQIIFEGDDRSAAAFNSVHSNFGTLATSVQGAADRMAGIATTIEQMDAALLALAVGGLALSVNAAGNFATQTAEIGTLVSDTSFDLGQYRDAILSYAETSTQSITSINSALYAAVSAGASWEDSIAGVAAAERLAVAGKAELTDATVLLMSTLNAYGAGMDEATHYSDVFFQTVRLGQTTLPELAEAFSRVSTLAATAGVPIETVAAAIAELTARGAPTSEAITGIRAAIQGIIDPTTAAAQTAASLGIEFNASALASRGLEGVLLDVYQATGGNIETMAQLFTSIEALTAVSALFGADGGAAFLQTLEAMRNAGGSVAEAYGQMVDQMENLNQRLLNSMQSTLIQVGTPLLEQYGDLVTSLADMFAGVNIALDAGAFAPVFAVLNEFSADLSTLLQGVAEALPEALSRVDFTGFTNALRDLAGAFGEYLGELDLTQPEDLAEVFQVLTDIITGLVRVTEGMVDAFRPYIEQVAEFFIELGRGNEETQRFAGEILATSQVISQAGLAVAAAMVAMQETGTSMASVLSVVGNSLSLVWNSVSIAVRETALAFTETAIAVNMTLNVMTLGQTEFLNSSLATLEGIRTGLQQSLAIDSAQWNNAMAAMTNGLVDFTNNSAAAGNTLALFRDGASDAAVQTAIFTRDADALTRALAAMPNEQHIDFALFGVEQARILIEHFGVEIESIPEEKVTALAAATDNASFIAAWEAITEYLPDVKETVATAITDGASLANAAEHIAAQIPEGRTVAVDAQTDTASLANAAQHIAAQVPEERTVDVAADPDTASIASTASQLDVAAAPRVATVAIEADTVAIERIRAEAATTQAALEWEARVDIAEAEANASIMESRFEAIQTAVEWQARLDIAEVQANAQIVEALANTLSSVFESSGEIISAAMDAFWEPDSMFDPEAHWHNDYLRGVIDQELDLRARAMDATEALVNTQIDYMQAKIRQMNNGDAMIQIDGTGLQPHLEAFMWEILSAIQVRVNEEGHAMLFGI
jgi:TP901 family phage tail tape measure protein